jgi:hypothetical protein
MRNIIVFLGCLLQIFLPSFSFATASKEVFSKYPNKYFIETGTYYGSAIRIALESGFKKIYSIELSPFYYKHTKAKFKDQQNVQIIQGDSAKILGSVIDKIQGRITFWLDAQYSGRKAEKGDTMSPLMQELSAIGQHPIKRHTIMIDDVRLLGTDKFDGITLNQVIQKIMSINPEYQIVFEDGYEEEDILVAYIK